MNPDELPHKDHLIVGKHKRYIFFSPEIFLVEKLDVVFMLERCQK